MPKASTSGKPREHGEYGLIRVRAWQRIQGAKREGGAEAEITAVERYRSGARTASTANSDSQADRSMNTKKKRSPSTEVE
jgi:hypothetical protein